MVRTVDNLVSGEEGIIKDYDFKGQFGRRLRELGILKGVLIKVEKRAPLSYPIQIRVNGYSLALRKEEAQSIKIE